MITFIYLLFKNKDVNNSGEQYTNITKNVIKYYIFCFVFLMIAFSIGRILDNLPVENLITYLLSNEAYLVLWSIFLKAFKLIEIFDIIAFVIFKSIIVRNYVE